MAYLVLVRHGESIWNAKGLWTGWTDVHLDEKGEDEADKSGDLIKDIKPEIAFTSALVRAEETLTIIQHRFGFAHDIPVTHAKELNERDYGKLTGKNKWEIEKEYGEEKFEQIRRGWNVPIPDGETLKDVYNRVLPYYQQTILPSLTNGKNVIIVAHGNSLRALIKFLENISDVDVEKLEIATGEVYIYQINQSGNVVSKEIRGQRPNTV